jgi:hypothetical protein
MATIEARAKEIQKYFKCKRVEHIRRFCRNGNILVFLKISENGDLLAIEGSQDEEL